MALLPRGAPFGFLAISSTTTVQPSYAGLPSRPLTSVPASRAFFASARFAAAAFAVVCSSIFRARLVSAM
eukprot:368866-Prymnesium_polylepis.1